MKNIFPVYRKYSNNKSFFKVLNENQFEEIQFIGKKCNVHQFTAKILPDRYLIKDMLEQKDNRWEEISEDEYESMFRNCKEGIQ